MTVPSRERIEEAVKVLVENEFGMWEGALPEGERTLLHLARAYLSSELVVPMSEEDIQTIIHLRMPLIYSEDEQELAHALVGKVAHPTQGISEFIHEVIGFLNMLCIEDIPILRDKKKEILTLGNALLKSRGE